jgi:hypothetical protein
MEVSTDFIIKVKNDFERKDKRRVLVYSSAQNEDTILHGPEEEGNGKKSSALFSIPIGHPEHYLLITVTPRPGKDRKSCRVELPQKAKLKFLPIEERETLISPLKNGRTAMIMEKGPHTWQLKVTRPSTECCTELRNTESRNGEEGDDDVTVGRNG